MATVEDPYDLDRFIEAQKTCYERALAEILGGDKRSHWMWYIFPQLSGLGFTPTSQKYSIRSLGEAEAYLAHLTLGPLLVECAEAALAAPGSSAHDIFG